MFFEVATIYKKQEYKLTIAKSRPLHDFVTYGPKIKQNFYIQLLANKNRNVTCKCVIVFILLCSTI